MYCYEQWLLLKLVTDPTVHSSAVDNYKLKDTH
uniref:Uncharacterized protein n=1 Tax=Anguilla anguilla TaxID=7936 RepID=A0A0E9TZ81_ANGAN